MRELTREGRAPWQLSSAWAGSCSVPCTWCLLAGLAVYCDELSGGSCFCGGGKKVVFVWLRSRGSGKGSGVIRNWCLGLVNIAHVLELPGTRSSGFPPSVIQPPGTIAGSRGVFFYDSVNIRAELLAQSSNSQERAHHTSLSPVHPRAPQPLPCTAQDTPAPPLCSPGHPRPRSPLQPRAP